MSCRACSVPIDAVSLSIESTRDEDWVAAEMELSATSFLLQR